MKVKIKSVSELNSYISSVLENDIILNNIYVRGEISGLSGKEKSNQFFDLKDEDSLIPCVLFQSIGENLKVELANDIAVVVSGKLVVYKKQGKYQIWVRDMRYDEEAMLHNEYLRLKAKLLNKGYFDEKRKPKRLPRIRRIGLIASKTSAAYGDFMKVIRSNYPILDIAFIDSYVSGEYTRIDVPLAIREFNKRNDVDLIVITRGGGSNEELFVYNDEGICDAVFESKIPVLSAIGHQRDLSLMDMTASFSVGTPSMAASLISEGFRRELGDLNHIMNNIQDFVALEIKSERRNLNFKVLSMLDQVKQAVYFSERELGDIKNNLFSSMSMGIERLYDELGAAYNLLKSYDIKETLDRGYALVMKDGKLVIGDEIVVGDELDIRLSSAELGVRVEKVKLPYNSDKSGG